jgi:hypothetical protein
VHRPCDSFWKKQKEKKVIAGRCFDCNTVLDFYEKEVFLKCTKCGKKESSFIACKNDHFLCQSCASQALMEKLYETLPTIEDKNPHDIAEHLLLKIGICSNIPHPMLAGALLTAIKNTSDLITQDDVLEGVVRASQIPPGWCGYYGSCGAAIAFGVSMSIVNKVTPADDAVRSLANEATALGLMEVAAQGGPQCCAGSVRGVVEVAIPFLEKHLNIKFPPRQRTFKKCWVTTVHPHCKKERCKYYQVTSN